MFCARTGLKPNPELAAKVKQHHDEYRRQKQGGASRKQPPRAHVGAKKPPVNPAAADSAGREAYTQG